MKRKLLKKNITVGKERFQVFLSLFKNDDSSLEYCIGVLCKDSSTRNLRHNTFYINNKCKEYLFNDSNTDTFKRKGHLATDALIILPNNGFHFNEIEIYIRKDWPSLSTKLNLQVVLNDLIEEYKKNK